MDEDADDGLAEALAEFREADDSGVRIPFDEVLAHFGLTQAALDEPERPS